jgi:hypothetical protein
MLPNGQHSSLPVEIAKSEQSEILLSRVSVRVVMTSFRRVKGSFDTFLTTLF